MKKRGGQTHSQVLGCHLILFHQVGHVLEEAQKRLKDVPALIGQQQDGSLHCLQPLLFGDICGKMGARASEEHPQKEPAGKKVSKLHLPYVKTHSSSNMTTTAKKEVIALALQLVRNRAGIGTSASNSRTQFSQGSSPCFSYSAHPFSNHFSVLVKVGSKPEHS